MLRTGRFSRRAQVALWDGPLARPVPGLLGAHYAPATGRVRTHPMAPVLEGFGDHQGGAGMGDACGAMSGPWYHERKSAGRDCTRVRG